MPHDEAGETAACPGDEKRQRWIVSLTVGYMPSDNRIVKRGDCRTKTDAQRKPALNHQRLRKWPGHNSNGYTVAQAATGSVRHAGRRDSPITKYAILAKTHIIPALGSRKFRELSADDVDRCLTAFQKLCS